MGSGPGPLSRTSGGRGNTEREQPMATGWLLISHPAASPFNYFFHKCLSLNAHGHGLSLARFPLLTNPKHGMQYMAKRMPKRRERKIKNFARVLPPGWPEVNRVKHDKNAKEKTDGVICLTRTDGTRRAAAARGNGKLPI